MPISCNKFNLLVATLLSRLADSKQLLYCYVMQINHCLMCVVLQAFHTERVGVTTIPYALTNTIILQRFQYLGKMRNNVKNCDRYIS